MKPGQRDSLGRRYGQKVKACRVCDGEFWPSNGCQKFCSVGCAKEAAMRTATCEGCGETFTFNAHNGKRRFCSPLCSNRATASERGKNMRLDRPTKPCEECGADFIPGRLGQRWCSQRCHGKSRRGQPRRQTPAWKTPRGFSLAKKGEARCRSCGRTAHHLHHIVPRSKSLKGETNLLNGLPLCFDCHRGWHDRRVTIPLTCLTLEEMLLAVDLTGPVWVERNYPIPSLMEQVEMVRAFGGLEMAYEAMAARLGPEFVAVAEKPLPPGETLLRFSQAVRDAGGIALALRRISGRPDPRRKAA